MQNVQFHIKQKVVELLSVDLNEQAMNTGGRGPHLLWHLQRIIQCSKHSKELQWFVQLIKHSHPAYLQITVRIQNDLWNQAIIRNHHRHCAKKSLKIVWQLRSSSIPRVHSDKRIACGAHRQFTSLKENSLEFVLDSQLNLKDLLCNNG